MANNEDIIDVYTRFKEKGFHITAQTKNGVMKNLIFSLAQN